MKSATPVRKCSLFFDAEVLESRSFRFFPFVNIPEIKKPGALQEFLYPVQIQVSELVPFGKNHQGIGTIYGSVFVVGKINRILDRLKAAFFMAAGS